MRCPTCRQDMNDPPRNGRSGEDCPECGQGLSKTLFKYVRRGVVPKKRDRRCLKKAR